MSSRAKTISRLLESQNHRVSYIRAKLDHLIPSQIRALRLGEEWSQVRLGQESGIKQSRISAYEKPGEASFSLETLIRLAAALRVGIQVRFVPYSQMLDWENRFSQDSFKVLPIEKDQSFISGSNSQRNDMRIGHPSSNCEARQNKPDNSLPIFEGQSFYGNKAASGGGANWNQ